METMLMDAANKESLFALLFVALLIVVLKEKRDLQLKSECREIKLQGIIEKLSDIIETEIAELKNKFECYIKK